MGMRQLLRRFSHDTSGATAIEYGLIACMIFVVIVGSLVALGDGSTGLYARVGNAIGPALDKALGTGDVGGESAEGGSEGED